MTGATWSIAVLQHVPETRWWARLLGRRTRTIVCHRFTPESLSLSMELNAVTNLSVVPGPAYRDVFPPPRPRNVEDDHAAFLFGWREDGDSATVTWHNEFARCPGCGSATVGLGIPYGINHAEGCDMPARAGLRRKAASA